MLASVIALAAATSPIIERNRFVVDKFYPAESALRGEQGDVTFRVRTNRKGQVDGCQVIHSSGYKRLDEATCDMILRGATAKPLQEANGFRVAGVRDAYVEWRLPARYAINSSPFDTKPGSPGVAINCHRQMRKASIIIQEKTCVTDSEWQKQVAFAQAETRAYQSGGACGNGGMCGF